MQFFPRQDLPCALSFHVNQPIYAISPPQFPASGKGGESNRFGREYVIYIDFNILQIGPHGGMNLGLVYAHEDAGRGYQDAERRPKEDEL